MYINQILYFHVVSRLLFYHSVLPIECSWPCKIVSKVFSFLSSFWQIISLQSCSYINQTILPRSIAPISRNYSTCYMILNINCNCYFISHFSYPIVQSTCSFINFITVGGASDIGDLNIRKRDDMMPNAFSTIRLALQCL